MLTISNCKTRRSLAYGVLLWLALPALIVTDHESIVSAQGDSIQVPGELRPGRYDNFGDLLPTYVCLRLGTTRLRHSRTIHAVAFSPDGTAFASGDESGTIRIWDFRTSKKRKQLVAESEIEGISYAPDGTHLVAVEIDSTLLEWELTTGRRVWQTEPGGLVSAFTFSPDGNSLITAGEGICLWDAKTGKMRKRLGAEGRYRFAVIAPGGRAIASVDHDWTIALWDVAAGKEVRRLAGHSAKLHAMSFSPDGRTLLVADIPKLYHMGSETETPPLRGYEVTNSPIAFSSDGKLLAVWHDDESVRLWDLTTGKAVRHLLPKRSYDLTGHSGLVWAGAFSPDGRSLVTGGDDQAVRVWDAGTGRDVRPFPAHSDAVASLAFSPDGSDLASAGRDGTIRLWDTARGRLEKTLRGHTDGVSCVRIAPDGRTLISAGEDGTVRLWDGQTATEVSRVKAHKGRVWQVAFLPNGRSFVSTGEDGMIRLWQVGRSQPVRQWGDRGVTGSAKSLAVSPDGQLVAATLGVGTIHLWEVSSGHQVRRLETPKEFRDFPSCVTFSPDGQVLACGEGTVVRLWGVQTGKLIGVCTADLGAVKSVGFSPDGRLLVGGCSDMSVRLWETITHREICRFTGHSSEILSVSFSPTGQAIASASRDSTILMWNLHRRLAIGAGSANDLTPERLEALWRDLALSDPGVAYRAVGLLTATPKETVSLLRTHMKPVSCRTGEEMARLIADLDDDAFTVRDQATGELASLEWSAEPAVRRALRGSLSPEARQRLQKLLARLESPVPPPDVVRLNRAVGVLETVASPQARQLLGTLAKGAPDARLSQDARASLQRLAGRKEK